MFISGSGSLISEARRFNGFDWTLEEVTVEAVLLIVVKLGLGELTRFAKREGVEVLLTLVEVVTAVDSVELSGLLDNQSVSSLLSIGMFLGKGVPMLLEEEEILLLYGVCVMLLIFSVLLRMFVLCVLGVMLRPLLPGIGLVPGQFRAVDRAGP